jgi:hypothetical protein
MRRLLAGVFIIMAIHGAPTSAVAGDECPPGQAGQPVPGHGIICVSVSDPGVPADEGPGATTHSTGVAMCTNQGKQIPCVTGDGVWFAAHQCYAQPLRPQPGPQSPAWQGHSPDEGQVWVCVTYAGPVTGGYWFFVANGETPALIDPADVAANAVGQLPLEVPAVHLAPSPPDLTFVGLATWLWIESSQWHDLSLTVTAGGTGVTVRAHPVRVTWDLTEGSTTCSSPGRPWVPNMSSRASTDCSYTFDSVSSGEPGGRYRVTATLTYQVDWTCSGACLSSAGSLGEVDSLPGRAAIRVGERQSVVVG